MDRRKGSPLVYIIIIVFGVFALGFSIAAVQRRNKLTTDFTTYYSYECETDAASTAFGVVAWLLLLFTQIMLMVVTSCFCGGDRLLNGGCCIGSIILLVFSWLSFLSALASLIAATVVNASYHGGSVSSYYGGGYYGNNDGGFSCFASKALFFRGAIFTVLTTILNVFYYLCFTMTPTKKRMEQIDFPAANPTVGMTTRTGHQIDRPGNPSSAGIRKS